MPGVFRFLLDPATTGVADGQRALTVVGAFALQGVVIYLLCLQREEERVVKTIHRELIVAGWIAAFATGALVMPRMLEPKDRRVGDE